MAGASAPSGGSITRRVPVSAFWGGYAASGQSGNASGPSGQVQPRASVPVPRRRAARALWRGTVVTTVNAPPKPAGQQPHGFASSRRPAGGMWGGAALPQPNASGPSGTVQPTVLGRMPRRASARGQWRGPAAVTTTNAVPPNPAGAVQPRATVPVPRRASARGQWRGQSTPQPHLPGQVQPHLVIARRSTARGIGHGIAVPGIRSLPVSGGLVKRRTVARALWSGTVVRTTNAPPVAVPAPKMRPRITSRAFARAVWRGCPPQPFNAPVAVMISLGQPFTDWGTDLPFTDWGTGKPFTSWDTGLLYAR